jgi:hypothetical protein
VRPDRSSVAREDSPTVAPRWPAARGRSLLPRDGSKEDGDHSCAEGDRFIADDFRSITVCDRSIADGDESITACNESKTARDRSIAVGARLISVSSRSIASSAAFFSRQSLVFPDRDGFTEKDEDTIMTTTIKSIHRATITLGIPGKVADLILYATNIVQKVTNNPSFPTPTPTVAVLAAAVNDLHDAETTALSRAKGSATVRNDKRTALVALLQQLDGYVQSVADATPENGAAIIESAGLTVRKSTPRGKRPFAARPGALSATAVVTAVSAGQRSSYEWQYSTDGGKTWVFAPATTQGKTTIAGLPSGTTVQFRYLAVTPKGGQGDWSAAVSLLVK